MGPNAGLTEVQIPAGFVTTVYDPVFVLSPDKKRYVGEQQRHADDAARAGPAVLARLPGRRRAARTSSSRSHRPTRRHRSGACRRRPSVRSRGNHELDDRRQPSSRRAFRPADAASTRPADSRASRSIGPRCGWPQAPRSACGAAGMWNVRAIDGLGVATFVVPLVGPFQGKAASVCRVRARLRGALRRGGGPRGDGHRVQPRHVHAAAGAGLVGRTNPEGVGAEGAGDHGRARRDRGRPVRRVHRADGAGGRRRVQHVGDPERPVVRRLRRARQPDADLGRVRGAPARCTGRRRPVDRPDLPRAAGRQGGDRRRDRRGLHAGAAARRVPRIPALRRATRRASATAPASWRCSPSRRWRFRSACWRARSCSGHGRLNRWTHANPRRAALVSAAALAAGGAFLIFYWAITRVWPWLGRWGFQLGLYQ